MTHSACYRRFQEKTARIVFHVIVMEKRLVICLCHVIDCCLDWHNVSLACPCLAAAESALVALFKLRPGAAAALVSGPVSDATGTQKSGGALQETPTWRSSSSRTAISRHRPSLHRLSLRRPRLHRLRLHRPRDPPTLLLPSPLLTPLAANTLSWCIADIESSNM